MHSSWETFSRGFSCVLSCTKALHTFCNIPWLKVQGNMDWPTWMCYVRQGLISNKTAEKLPQILRPRGHSSDFRASPKWNSIFEKITQRSFRKDHQGSRVCKSNKSIEGQYREQESHWTDATDALEQTSLDRDNIAGPAWNGEDIRHAKICKDEFDAIKMIP